MPGSEAVGEAWARYPSFGARISIRRASSAPDVSFLFFGETVIVEPSGIAPATSCRPMCVSRCRWMYRFSGRAP